MNLFSLRNSSEVVSKTNLQYVLMKREKITIHGHRTFYVFPCLFIVFFLARNHNVLLILLLITKYNSKSFSNLEFLI